MAVTYEELEKALIESNESMRKAMDIILELIKENQDLRLPKFKAE